VVQLLNLNLNLFYDFDLVDSSILIVWHDFLEFLKWFLSCP